MTDDLEYPGENEISPVVLAKLLADRAELVAALERIEQTLDYGQFSNALTLARAALAKAKG